MPEPMDERTADDPPRTEDARVDAALQDLAAAPEPTPTDTGGERESLAEDLDAVLAAGEDVHRRLTARLSDLGT